MIADMQTQMAGTTICVLSDAAATFPASLLKLFPEELDRTSTAYEGGAAGVSEQSSSP